MEYAHPAQLEVCQEKFRNNELHLNKLEEASKEQHKEVMAALNQLRLVVAGNGDYKTSVMGRVQTLEEQFKHHQEEMPKVVENAVQRPLAFGLPWEAWAIIVLAAAQLGPPAWETILSIVKGG